MNGSLFLTPCSPGQSCASSLLVDALQALGVVGRPITTSSGALLFHAGEQFARHVVYAGCSPYLRFEPEHPQDRAFCHVAVLGPYDQPRLITGPNTAKPRCPQCRARLADWPQRAASGATRACPACNAALRAIDLDWRQQAAVGRVLVELRNVFPGEATPSDQLLDTLHRASELPWCHAWAAQTTD